METGAEWTERFMQQLWVEVGKAGKKQKATLFLPLRTSSLPTDTRAEWSCLTSQNIWRPQQRKIVQFSTMDFPATGIENP